MAKYDWNLIIDYVNGKDINDYDAGMLENNVDFMIQVIDYTNDKNIYNLCGENVLNDYKFIKYLVSKFKDDISFIVDVADKFLDSHVDEDINYDCVELNFIMSNYVDGEDNLEYSRYTIYKNAFYQIIISELFSVLGDEQVFEYDLGFAVINEIFAGRNEILDYFASQFVYCILYKNIAGTFEKRVHDDIKSFNSVKKIGIRNYLISFLRKYDAALAGYVSKSVDLLLDGVKSLEKIENNWDNYVRGENLRKFGILEREIFDYYMAEDACLPSFSAYDLIDYIIVKMGLTDSYMDCFGYSCSDGFEEISSRINGDKLSLIDYKFCKFGFSIANELFKKNIIVKPETDSDKKNDDVSNCKVIKFELKEKKN